MIGSQNTLRAAVFLGLSVDGRIARPDGDLEWLISRGAAAGDAGFTPFLESVDALVMGRKTYEAIAPEEHWPYQDRPVHVISTTLTTDHDPRITVHRSPEAAVDALQRDGHQRVYVDGGETVRWFLAAELVDELTLSQVPVLIGDGPSLFGPLGGDVHLEHVRTAVLDGGMVQTTYRVAGGPMSPAAEQAGNRSPG
ncbi:dihydrofolate reductase family protein [Brachybacterium sp. YJGR34]|uniref:dihydrofolate reductase family protein n=1 Tax=Brachybacterium sp. YJGR34 TaxID=2059911 RepID=UPI000E0A7FA0|nr:dihydrofolate reductase family protein [Brachybacterium sp. YJGR34]